MPMLVDILLAFNNCTYLYFLSGELGESTADRVRGRRMQPGMSEIKKGYFLSLHEVALKLLIRSHIWIRYG